MVTMRVGNQPQVHMAPGTFDDAPQLLFVAAVTAVDHEQLTGFSNDFIPHTLLGILIGLLNDFHLDRLLFPVKNF